MTPIVLAVVLAVAPEVPGGCASQQLTSALVSGPLAFAREDDRLFMTFAHMDSSVGLSYPMRLKRNGRTLTVSIMPPPERVSMPAFGTNHGRLELPKELSGKFRLDVRFSGKRARFDLDIAEGIIVTPRGATLAELTFAASEWRTTPPGFTRVRCVENSACAVKACADLRTSPPLSTAPALANGAYLDAALYASSCIARLTDDELAALRARSAELEAQGCGQLVIDPPAAR